MLDNIVIYLNYTGKVIISRRKCGTIVQINDIEENYTKKWYFQNNYLLIVEKIACSAKHNILSEVRVFMPISHFINNIWFKMSSVCQEWYVTD